MNGTHVKLIVIAVAVCLLDTANATIIDFENGIGHRPDLGFNVSNPAGDLLTVVAGESLGDPDSWDIEGSNGSRFLGVWGDWPSGLVFAGYNGLGDTAYSSLYFTEENSAVREQVNITFDVLLRTGNFIGSDVTFFGFKDGEETAFSEVVFSLATINGYSEYIASISFSDVDEIRYDNNRPFGLDNFNYDAVPEPSTLAFVGVFAGGLFAVRRLFMI